MADRYCKRKRTYNTTGGHGSKESTKLHDDDIVMDMYTTCCKRECIEDFHKAGQERATAEVAQLDEFIHNMPDGPQKAHFLKRVWCLLCDVSIRSITL